MVTEIIQRNKLLVRMLCGLIILASGTAIGAGTTIMLVKHHVMWISKPHKDANEITEMISKKYGLNPQQTQQVQQIIDKAFQQRKQSDEEEDKRREAGIQTIIAEMNDVLTPEQFERWNKDFQVFREKHKKPAQK